MLPGAIVFGLGLVTFVAPLTATVMAAADRRPRERRVGREQRDRARGEPRRARTSSRWRRAHVRGPEPTAVTHAFRIALVIAAVIMGAATPIALVGLRAEYAAAPSARRVHCAIDGAPLQPDPDPSRARGSSSTTTR